MDDPGRTPDDRSSQPMFTSRRRQRATDTRKRIALGLLALAVVAAGVWWFWLRSPDGGGMGTAGPPAADTGDVAASPQRPDVEPLDLPPLEESDPLVRRLGETLSSHPRLASWLVTDDLVRRFVTSVVNMAESGSPASQLRFVAPEEPFAATEAGGRLVVDSASYRRYDLLADVFTSLDTEGTATLYLQLHPLFEEVYADLGTPRRSFDQALAMAVGNLLAVDVPEGPVAVVPEGAVYEFEDPAREGLTPAQKHLLRMGPRNARRMQAKLRALADAVGIQPVAPG